MVSRESGIEDKTLARSLTPKVLGLLSALAERGHVSEVEILDSLHRTPDNRRTAVADDDLADRRHLEAELDLEKKARAFLEDEVSDLQFGRTKLVSSVREAERRDADSRRRLDELQGQTARLIATTREAVESLQTLREELNAAGVRSKHLAEHVRRIRAVVESVQRLRAPQNRESRGRAADHTAR